MSNPSYYTQIAPWIEEGAQSSQAPSLGQRLGSIPNNPTRSPSRRSMRWPNPEYSEETISYPDGNQRSHQTPLLTPPVPQSLRNPSQARPPDGQWWDQEEFLDSEDERLMAGNTPTDHPIRREDSSLHQDLENIRHQEQENRKSLEEQQKQALEQFQRQQQESHSQLWTDQFDRARTIYRPEAAGRSSIEGEQQTLFDRISNPKQRLGRGRIDSVNLPIGDSPLGRGRVNIVDLPVLVEMPEPEEYEEYEEEEDPTSMDLLFPEGREASPKERKRHLYDALLEFFPYEEEKDADVDHDFVKQETQKHLKDMAEKAPEETYDLLKDLRSVSIGSKGQLVPLPIKTQKFTGDEEKPLGSLYKKEKKLIRKDGTRRGLEKIKDYIALSRRPPKNEYITPMMYDEHSSPIVLKRKTRGAPSLFHEATHGFHQRQDPVSMKARMHDDSDPLANQVWSNPEEEKTIRRENKLRKHFKKTDPDMYLRASHRSFTVPITEEKKKKIRPIRDYWGQRGRKLVIDPKYYAEGVRELSPYSGPLI